MPFPDFARVLFKKSPLDQVICQVRFPPILRVDAEIPAQFQERIRQSFPNFSETSEWILDAPPVLMGPLPPEVMRQIVQSPGNMNYQFISDDNSCWVNLTRNFVSLTTKQYGRWEAFKDNLQDPLSALAEVYAPSHFSRVGLRYIDVIKRSVLGLENHPWSRLLQPYISSMLASDDVAPNIKDFENRYEIGLSDGESTVRIITKSAQSADGEVCYVIDSDFSTTVRCDIVGAFKKLDYFNSRSSRLIQWCITDELRSAMEPVAL